MKYLAPFLVLISLLTLHDPSGHKVYIVKEQVMSITPPGGCGPEANAKLNLTGAFQCVQETIEQVVEKMQAQ